jgi:DNA-binding HxlR family transcriptional regulator
MAVPSPQVSPGPVRTRPRVRSTKHVPDPHPTSDPSPLDRALDLVGDRWTLRVVAALRDGPERFSELQSLIPGIATNVLAQRLRQLEADGLVLARAYQDRPARYVYELTEAARGLGGALDGLAAWGAGQAPADAAPRHDVCGTPLTLRWWCEACEVPVDAPEHPTTLGDDLHFA